MNIFQNRYSTGQVVLSTGVTNAALQSWLRRNLIVGHKEGNLIEGGGSPGIHRQFSFFNVMEIAIAKALMDAGMGSVSDAFRAGMAFAHVGHGSIPGLQSEREPGLPYGGACLTVLCVRQDQSIITRWVPKADVFVTARSHLGDGFMVLEVNPIFERVTAALGYDFRDVLIDAYGNLD